MNHDDVLAERWSPLGRIPLGGVPGSASWHRARTKHSGESVVLFVASGESALDVADAARRAALVEDAHLFPIRDITALQAEDGQDVTVVEYPMPSAPSLTSVLKRAPLRPETARALLGAVATGIEAGRRRGVRHRHLDSNRVFADLESGEVTILGLGVETAADGPSRTAAGLSSHEESAAAAHEDVTAIMAMLYKALTGSAPHRGADGRTPLASAVSPRDVPGDLDRLCDAVLNGSDDSAPSTSRELLEALGPFQSIPVTLEAYDAYEHDLEERERREREEREREEREATEPAAQLESSELPAQDDESNATTLPGEETQPGGAARTSAAAGIAGATVAASAVGTAEEVPAAEEATETAPEGGAAEASGTPADHDSAGQARNEREAQQLIDDLHLDRPRDGAAFPGSMSIAPAGAVAGGVAAAAAARGADNAADDGDDPADRSSAQPEDETHTASDQRSFATSGTSEQTGTPEDRTSAPQERTSWGDAINQEPPRSRAFTVRPSGGGADAPAAHGTDAAADAAALSEADALPESDAPSESDALSESDAPSGSDAASVSEEDGDADKSTVLSTPTETVRVRNGRQALFDDDQGSGPIIVPGRDRSITEGPEAAPAPDRSHLLRDVVSVATASSAGGSYASYGHHEPEERSRQAQWIIVGGVLAVILFLVLAVVIVTSGLRDRGEGPSAQERSAATPPAASPTAEAPSSPAETSQEPIVEPTLAGAEAFAVGGDVDHPEMQDLAVDGDPETGWTTQRYNTAQFGRLRENVGLTVRTEEPASIGSVTVATANTEGGMIELRALGEDGQPTGEPLASAPIASEVELTPEEPLQEADGFALVVTELPPNPDGEGFRVEITEVSAAAPAQNGEAQG